MTFELSHENLPDLLAGLGMLAIAALLLWVAPRNRVHRAFALFQVVTAGGSLDSVWRGPARGGCCRSEDACRASVFLALRDDAPSREKERDLVVIATRLGITPERAFDIRNEVERESRGAQREAG